MTKAHVEALEAAWLAAYRTKQAKDTDANFGAEQDAWEALSIARADANLCREPGCWSEYPCPEHDDLPCQYCDGTGMKGVPGLKYDCPDCGGRGDLSPQQRAKLKEKYGT
jgi:hypothetical protein